MWLLKNFFVNVPVSKYIKSEAKSQPIGYLRGVGDLDRTVLSTITLLQDTFPDYQKTFVINI